MRASVSERSSQMSGSSSTISALGFAMRSGLLPALRIREHDPEDAPAAGARLVDEQCAVALGKLAGDEKAETRAARARGEEWLEDAVADGRVDARAAIQHLEERSVAAREPANAQLDLVFRDLHRVAERVLAEVPQDLAQVRGIHAHLELGIRHFRHELCRVVAARTDEFLREVRDPVGERHPLGSRGLAARELLHVADDRADTFGVRLDDIAEAPAALGDVRIFAEELRGMADRAD